MLTITGWLLTRPPGQQDVIFTVFEQLFSTLYTNVVQFMEPKMDVCRISNNLFIISRFLCIILTYITFNIKDVKTTHSLLYTLMMKYRTVPENMMMK